MKNRIVAAFTAFVLVMNFATLAFADVKPKKGKKVRANPLVALLPPSDGVLTLDMKRLVGEALPQILSGNQAMLNEIFGKIDEVKARTGIDLRQFEHVAVGIESKRISEKHVDFEPVIIARGQFNAGALTAIAKLASNGTYREEKIGDKTLYIFSAKEIAEKNAPRVSNSILSKAIDKMFDGLTKEIALTSLGRDTLAFGSVPRVRQTVEAGSNVDGEVSNLLLRKPNAMMSFAAKVPNGLSDFISLDNDELGKTLDSIRFLHGSMDIAGGSTAVSMMARTLKPEQVKSLLETLEGLQIIGKAILGGSKSADKQVYARMIDNVKFSRAGNEVMLDLQIQQADIDILTGGIK